MSDLRELYQEIILDHCKRPRNFHPLEDADHHAEGHNPLCGDKVTVYLKLNQDKVKEISFLGAGCAISMASASLMTEAAKGKNLGELLQLISAFHRLVTSFEPKSSDEEQLGKLMVFEGVTEFPVRIKCATLPWHTLQAALKSSSEKKEIVSTE